MFREAACLVLAPELLAVGGDVEDSAGALDQLGFYAEFLFDGVRQTGGGGLVVSLHAEFDGDIHVYLLQRR